MLGLECKTFAATPPNLKSSNMPCLIRNQRMYHLPIALQRMHEDLMTHNSPGMISQTHADKSQDRLNTDQLTSSLRRPS